MDRHMIGADCEILVGRGLPSPLLPTRPGRARVAILGQAGCEDVVEDLAAALRNERVEVAKAELLPGEEGKELAALEPIYAFLAQAGITRGDTVLVAGGGAATDAGGFVAATWLRGVEAVYVPTTLVGAVDAAIGGKTAVNVAGKNLVGVFRHPARVLVDLEVLERLPEALLRQGAAEALKAGLIADRGIVETYLAHGLDAPLDQIVGPAIAVKTHIVGSDFTEQGQRAVLNLGHTVGHAIEFAAGISHGEAVALGMRAAIAVSAQKIGFRESDVVTEAIGRLGLPEVAPPADRQEVRRLLNLDKKRDHQGLRMVLLEAIGSPVVTHVEPSDLERALDAIGL